MMLQKRDYKFWFCPGSVDLYGDEEIRIVTEHSRKIVDEMNQSGLVPYEIVLKPTLLTNENIRKCSTGADSRKCRRTNKLTDNDRISHIIYLLKKTA